MSVAYYMKFVKGHFGAKNIVGGQPTHIPQNKPWPIEDDPYFGFLMELWVDGKMLNIPRTKCIQIYQSIEEGDDPQPEIVKIPLGAELNQDKNILVHPCAEAWDIEFQEIEDPDDLPEISMKHNNLFRSKLGGIDPWGYFEKNPKFLGQISEIPINFNFGGMLCSLYLDSSDKVIAILH